eukprot:488626-Rhodomonas_salina.2
MSRMRDRELAAGAAAVSVLFLLLFVLGFESFALGFCIVCAVICVVYVRRRVTFPGANAGYAGIRFVVAGFHVIFVSPFETFAPASVSQNVWKVTFPAAGGQWMSVQHLSIVVCRRRLKHPRTSRTDPACCAPRTLVQDTLAVGTR